MIKRQGKITSIALQRRFFWMILSGILVLFSLYGYFVSRSVTNVLMREEIEDRILAVNSDISELEFEYLEKKNAVTLELAHTMGYKDISGKEFVARKSVLAEQLTLNTGNLDN